MCSVLVSFDIMNWHYFSDLAACLCLTVTRSFAFSCFIVKKLFDLPCLTVARPFVPDKCDPVVCFSPFHSDPAVHAMQFLDVITMKDPSQKSSFFRSTLPDVLPYIPRVSYVWQVLLYIHQMDELPWTESECAH